MAKTSELARVLADIDAKIAHLQAARDAILASQQATRVMKPSRPRKQIPPYQGPSAPDQREP